VILVGVFNRTLHIDGFKIGILYFHVDAVLPRQALFWKKFLFMVVIMEKNRSNGNYDIHNRK
jgi:hypothetical protein